MSEHPSKLFHVSFLCESREGLCVWKHWSNVISDRVLESLKAGKRLPEARFATLKVAPKGQASVYGRFAGQLSRETSNSDGEGKKTTG